MEEGIRIDSCDEWNTDFMFDESREKYPLSNACGQYGRSYEDETCTNDEPFQCALNKTMQTYAVDGNTANNIPLFTCRARTMDGESEIFPGYYDAADNVVLPCKLMISAFLFVIDRHTNLISSVFSCILEYFRSN